MRTLLKTILISSGFAGSVAAANPKVLVILSSENKITVNETPSGGDPVEHPTGFFLSEMMVPLRALDSNYEFVFASPSGGYPVMDAVSDNAMWFEDETEYQQIRSLCVAMKLCGDATVGTLKTNSFDDILQSGLDQFAGVFFPGGHAPMEDLVKNSTLGKILEHFHNHSKPTALICHAPIALLAAQDDPRTYAVEMEKLTAFRALGDEDQIKSQEERLRELSASWIYRGYRMAAFSTAEEKQEEPGEDNVLGGYVKFYPDAALDAAGAAVATTYRKWQPNVIVDRELITGQNPFSDKALAKELLRALQKRK